MPLRSCGVLAGLVVDVRSAGGTGGPQRQVRVLGGDTTFTVTATGADDDLADGDHRRRIVAALVNGPPSAPAPETVTLPTTRAVDPDLDGWALLDSADRRVPLTGTALGAGEAARVRLTVIR